jgi:hypothetical protein
MARIHAPNRDTLVTILLILAGVLLAMTLFGAGAFWKGRTSRPNGNLGRAVPTSSVNRFRKSHDSEALLSICRTGLVFVKSLIVGTRSRRFSRITTDILSDIGILHEATLSSIPGGCDQIPKVTQIL